TNASGGQLATYAQSLGIDDPFSMFRAGTASFYNADGLSTKTSLSDSSGAIVQSYVFDSFGKLGSTNVSLVNPFQYTGRDFDQETGLYYSRARYYVPSTGRFLSEDPAAFAAGLNFYSYARNSPEMWIDPFGLEEGSANNLRTRNNIDALAQSYE